MTTEIKPQREDIHCWRCGALDVFWHLVTLVGNYHAKLCQDCLNDHAQWLFALPEFTALQEAEIIYRQLYAMVQHDGIDRTHEIKSAHNRINDIQNAIFRLTEVWVSEKIERPKPPEPEKKDLTREEKISNARRRLAFAQRQLQQAEDSTEETT